VQSIRVAIPDAAVAKLLELADRQYRAPRQQAAVMLVEAIERASRPNKAADSAVGDDQPDQDRRVR